MQAGIGGKTVSELRQNMSFDELNTWMAYRQKHGPLHLGLRVDRGFAQVSYILSKAHFKGRPKMIDFMPYADRTQTFGINDDWDNF